MEANQNHQQVSSPPSLLLQILQQLPDLPSNIRYYDDFDDKLRTLKDIKHATKCEIYVNGTRVYLYFDRFSDELSTLAKHLLLYLVSEDFQPGSVYNYIQSLYRVTTQELVQVIEAGPLGIKKLWQLLLAKEDWTIGTYRALKSLLNFLSINHLCGWSPAYSEFLSKALPLPGVDKYASIRSGDVFLSMDEESRIVQYLDSLAALLKQNPPAVDFENLTQGAMLLCSYQFGMRPIQIASLTLRDVKIWADQNDDELSVHLTFRTVKQHTQSSSRPLLRKVKREWASIFCELHNRQLSFNLSAEERILPVKTAQQVSTAISKLSSSLIGRDTSANILRHTAAQRLVDAGASQEELAEFMGHTDITTGLVYFRTSPSQAERINQALGISSIYQRVAKIAHDRFISPQELAELKGDQQIAGVPHGIPIAGIGGCSGGQPSCPFNPVTSCYGCHKFMPLRDAKIHRRVLEDLREIVVFFNEASKGDLASPTYLQLQRTISGVQQVIAEIESA